MDNQNTELIGASSSFVWREPNGSLTYLNLHNRTKAECLRVARAFGYVERCWYRPSTWGNRFKFYYKK